jgi:hypothetical protein
VNVQSRQINSHVHGRPILQSARLGIHSHGTALLSEPGSRVGVGVGSTARKSYASNPRNGQEVSFILESLLMRARYLSGSATAASHERTFPVLGALGEERNLLFI